MALFDSVPQEPKKTVTVSFNQSILEEMDLRRSKVGMSRSVYLRLALLEYFRKEDDRQK